MSHPNTFTTPSGDEMVILTRAEYDALVDAATEAEEDAADAAIYADRKAALGKGLDAVLPAEVSALIGKGHSRLKAIRKWRGESQVDVAAYLGLSQGHLSDLETGRRKVTSEIAHRLAGYFNVHESWLEP